MESYLEKVLRKSYSLKREYTNSERDNQGWRLVGSGRGYDTNSIREIKQWLLISIGQGGVYIRTPRDGVHAQRPKYQNSISLIFIQINNKKLFDLVTVLFIIFSVVPFLIFMEF